MKAICRLILPFKEPEKMENVLNAGFEATGTTWNDIYTSHSEYGTHFGNWVVVPVLNNEATHKLAAHFATNLDMFGNIIEKSDLESLKIGDKVKVQLVGFFANTFEEKGTVLRFENEGNTVVIKKKGSHTKGWKISVNQEAAIWKDLDSKSKKEEK